MKRLLDLDYKDNNGYIYINIEDYNKLFNKGNYQSTVFVKDEQKAEDVVKELENNGYSALYVKDTLVTMGFTEFTKIMGTVTKIVLLITLFFISYFIIKIISPILNIVKFPKEIVPLAILRPISGSASMAIATNIIKQNGVDSKIGLIASVIMGATETTLYTIAVYTSSINVKKSRYILIASLMADITGIIMAIIICEKICRWIAWKHWD